MKVLLAGPGMALGGAEQMVAALAGGLLARGHAVTVSGPAGALDRVLDPAVERILLPERGRSPAGAAEWIVRLAAAVRRQRPDVVHAHNAKATAAAAAAVRVARGPRRPPVLATHHGAAVSDRAAAARLLAHLADEVAVVSEDLLPPLLALGLPAERLRVIHNGVAPPPPPDGARLDAELGLDGGPVVSLVGRLVPVKGPERFLHAAARVRAAAPDARFLVVGDGPLRARLETLAAELGLNGAVRFTGPRSDARAVIARSDILVVASDSEGQSVVALEALAAGVPVVSTPVPGMRGLLGGGAGVIVDGFHPDALADAVAALLRAPAERAAMGAAGAGLVSERFSADMMVDAYLRRYEALARPAYHPSSRLCN